MKTKGRQIVPGPKQCKRCLEYKERENFRAFRKNSNAIRSNCFDCEKLIAKDWRDNNPESLKLVNRRARLKSAWGLTPESFDAMLAGQGGGCAICHTKVPGGKGGFKVDHCHTTGAIRGLLCQLCNLGLGHFTDSTTKMQSAISYLNKSRGQ